MTVAVPPGNGYHGRHYDDIEDIDVHGGLTYSESAVLGEVSFGSKTPIRPKYVGRRNPIFDNAEYVDGNPEDIGDDWWVFGFDTFHFGDNPEEWDREAVIRETMYLMEQLTEEEEEK